jgi:hypothetical protein
VCFAMTTETEQLLVLLQSIAQARPLTQEHRVMLLKTLQRSPSPVMQEAWAALPPWQCERIWEIARAGRA